MFWVLLPFLCVISLRSRELIVRLLLTLSVNTHLLKVPAPAWLMEVLAWRFSFFVLVNLVYELKWAQLVAHQMRAHHSGFCVQTYCFLSGEGLKKKKKGACG